MKLVETGEVNLFSDSYGLVVLFCSLLYVFLGECEFESL